MMTISEIRRVIDCARENTVCNYDENEPASQRVRLSLEQAETISKSLVRLERLLAARIEGGA